MLFTACYCVAGQIQSSSSHTSAGHTVVLGGADSSLALRGDLVQSSWNGARFAPYAAMPPPPDGSVRAHTVLLADQAAHKVVQGWLAEDGQVPITAPFCSSTEMVEPNDIVVASNGRVWATGMFWGRNTVVGHGDLWTCSPSTVAGGSVAARLARMGRTNGIELSPDGTLPAYRDHLHEHEILNCCGLYILWELRRAFWPVDESSI